MLQKFLGLFFSKKKKSSQASPLLNKAGEKCENFPQTLLQYCVPPGSLPIYSYLIGVGSNYGGIGPGEQPKVLHTLMTGFGQRSWGQRRVITTRDKCLLLYCRKSNREEERRRWEKMEEDEDQRKRGIPYFGIVEKRRKRGCPRMGFCKAFSNSFQQPKLLQH